MKNTYKIKKLSSFRELVERSAKKFAHKNAFVLRDGKDNYRTIKYKELKERYYSLCSYFLSQGFKGKSIAVIGGNSYEWTLCYLAAASVGTVVPLDKELSVEDIDNFLDYAECDTICADGKIISALSFGSQKQYNVISFESVDKDYSHFNYDNLEKLKEIEISKDKTSALIFTSGTTGSAKGVCLSQHNLLSNICSSLKMVKFTSKDRTLSILPLHHTYECTLNCLLMLSVGACITYADSLLKITKNVVEYSPSVLVVVPALLKMMDKKITQSVKSNCPERYKHLFDGEQFSQAFVKLPYLIRRIISAKVRKSLGGELRLFIVGAADLDCNIVENFSAMGIRVLQGYGLTECSPLVAGNSDFYFNAKSTGRAIPDVQVRIDTPNSDGIGEILVKGENVMLGYYKDEIATAKVFDNGWFRTGDLGRMDADGALYITGRSKNVIVTENGKNIYPEELEARLSNFSEIEDVLVVASQERGKLEVKAKIFPNIDALKSKIGHVPSLQDIKNSIGKIVKEINSKMPNYKRISFFELLDKSLEKTTTRKIKRFGNNVN